MLRPLAMASFRKIHTTDVSIFSPERNRRNCSTAESKSGTISKSFISADREIALTRIGSVHANDRDHDSKPSMHPSLHFMRAAFAIQDMSRLPYAFALATSWLIAAHDIIHANLFAADDLLLFGGADRFFDI